MAASLFSASASKAPPILLSKNTIPYSHSVPSLIRFNFHRPHLNLFCRPFQLPTKPNSSSKSSVRCLFTGIVEEVGEIKQLGTTRDGGFDLKIGAKVVLQDVNLGDSIAVNGTCLTVTEFDKDVSEFKVGLSPETLRMTSLTELVPCSLVNLERAVQPTSRMGGHFVQGHIDGTGEIVGMEAEEDALWVKVKTSKEILKYVVAKGFIAVDGTSLTVVNVFEEEECFDLLLVAYTQQAVVLPLKKVGQKVNLEVDILGKYVERLLCCGFVQSLNSASSFRLDAIVTQK